MVFSSMFFFILFLVLFYLLFYLKNDILVVYFNGFRT